MPIYEFYCSDCHTIFSFLSRRIRPRRRPGCPRCGRPRLEKRVSAFSVSRGRAEPESSIDEARLEQVMNAMAGESDGLDESDPRAVAGMMRRLYEGAGLAVGGGMEEALRRMEAGEDPDKIEEEMGELLEQEDPFLAAEERRPGRLRRHLRPPSRDETLHEL